MTVVAAFPFIRENPYQELLYEELARYGFDVDRDSDFKLRGLFRQRRRVRVLHFHWPKNYYGWWRRPTRLRTALSWLKLPLFALRLAGARALGLTIVWTIHEVFPHERSGRGIDRLGGILLARASHLLIALDRGTASRAEAELRVPADRIRIIPLPSYIGAYPAGKPRGAVRRELGIPQHSFVFLCFGHLRAYKNVELLLEAFASHDSPDVSLVVAGLPLDERLADAVREAAVRDPRIKPLLGFVPDARVAELFEACDAAVVPRGDGGTSGALVLALSMGRPVVAARTPDYEELTGGEDAGWLFTRNDRNSLAAALVTAASDPNAARAKGAVALSRAERITWPAIGEHTAMLIYSAMGAPLPQAEAQGNGTG